MIVLDEIKLRLGEISIADDLLQSFINELTYKIIHYCNLPENKEPPEGLQYVLVRMVVDNINNDGNGSIGSMKVGDTQINYTQTAEQLITSYQTDLNRFRRLVWP